MTTVTRSYPTATVIETQAREVKVRLDDETVLPRWYPSLLDATPIGMVGTMVRKNQEEMLFIPHGMDFQIESGESIFFLEDEDDGVVAGYKVMDNPAQLLVEAYVTQSTVTDTAIIQSWITDAGHPGTSFIPEGAWLFHVNAYKTGGTKEVRIYNEIYKRDLAGTETLLETTANSIPLTDVEAILPAFNVYIPGVTLLETDRIVTKTRIRLLGTGSNPTSVTIGYSGATAARLSIPAQAVDVTTIVRTTGDQTIEGVKTFVSSPIVPTPTTEFQATTKGYVDTQLDTKATKSWLNALDYGADPTGVADSTAAFEAAMAASYDGAWLPHPTPVYFPAGKYLLNDADWNNMTPIIGAGGGFTYFFYGGAGAAGSSVIRNSASLGTQATPYGGFTGFSIMGRNIAGTVFSEHCYRNTGAGGVDWGMEWEDVQVLECYGDAIVLTNTGGYGFVNLFMRRMRFDGIGGFAIRLQGAILSNRRTFSLDSWTIDNQSVYVDEAFTAGHGDGNAWGKGLLLVEGGDGLNVVLGPGSMEFNRPLVAHNGHKSLVHIANSTYNVTTVNINGVRGYGYNGDQMNVVSENAAHTATVSFNHGADFFWIGMPFKSTDVERCLPDAGGPMFGYTSNANPGKPQAGVTLNGMRLEGRTGTPGSGSAYYAVKAGDRVFKTDTYVGINTEWICTSPFVGYAQVTPWNITTTAGTTAASATVTVPDAAMSEFIGLEVGANVTITGAGVAGATLSARVTARGASVAGRTSLTITPAASTTVANTATMAWDTPTWTATGIVGGVQAAAQADSVAATVGALVTDFNALLAKFRAANLLDT